VIGDLFDNPWKVLIVAAVLIVLFGSKKLPDAARSLGRSMRILKTEVSSLHQDESGPAAEAPGNTSGTRISQAQLTQWIGIGCIAAGALAIGGAVLRWRLHLVDGELQPIAAPRTAGASWVWRW